MSNETQLSITPEPSLGAMLSKFIDNGITEQNVQAFGKLLELRERMEDRDAEKQFAVAFAALQSDLPHVQASKAVPNNDGTVRYRFAPYESIMEQVRPFLQKHGFSLTFSSDFKESRIIQTCTLQHIGGHKRSNQFAVRVGKGPPGSSESQGDGAASTYAKRFALCDALNIVVDAPDSDARLEGASVTKEQAETLRQMVTETGADEFGFLNFAGADRYAEIPSSKYDICVAALKKKAKKA